MSKAQEATTGKHVKGYPAAGQRLAAQLHSKASPSGKGGRHTCISTFRIITWCNNFLATLGHPQGSWPWPWVVGGRGTSGALPGPSAVNISEIPRAAEKQIHSSKIHWRLLSVGGHLWPGKCLRFKLLEAAEYYRGIIIPWPGLHQHVTGDSRGQ